MTGPRAEDDRSAREERVAQAFLELWISDVDQGRARPLAEYLARFPGFEERIAAEWTRARGALAEAPAPPPSASGATGATGEKDARAIGPYRLIREIGRGGQGTVYLAEDTRVARTVALKVLMRSIDALDSAAELRFRREAQALARLEHEGIATVFEVGQSEDTAWIAMRHVGGGSLQQAIAARVARGVGPPRTPSEIAEVVRLGERAARALAAAHAAGILHRDVKPANILLAAPDQPVLVDFGLAQDDQGSTPTITLPGAVFGTLCYLPPERLTGSAADVRADVYALGASLYEALALERPYQASTTAAELRAIVHDALPDVRAKNPAVGRDLALVIATALAREPSARYGTATALADDLACVSGKRPIHARPPTLADRLARFCQRERALAGAIGAAFAVLLVGLVLVTWLWRANTTALSAVTRLADLKLARELRQREDGLWPARPERVPLMKAWLADAERLRERTPEHTALLASLPPLGSNETADWQRDQLESLHRELSDFDARIAAVGARVASAESLRARTIEGPAAAWAAACERIKTNPVYGGLDLRPQLGLVPLGPDPRSGLEEFAHVLSGTIPGRDADGALEFDEDSCVVLVLVPGGKVVLGADKATPADGRPANVDAATPDEQTPSYEAELDPYFLSRFEMTQAQWLRHTGTNPSTYRPDTGLTKITGLLHPVELVTWVEVDRALHQLDLRIPTEAQWERAYRAGTSTPYPYGEAIESLGGHENLADRAAEKQGMNRQLRFLEWLDDGHMVHAPVGGFDPNAFGFHDMGGNVKEWCDDSWENYAAATPRAGDGLRRGAFERYRVVRGGCFASWADEARSASRYGGEKDTRGAEAGVRPARDVER